MSKAKCIMVQGTMSGAGKSLLCAALCRIFAQDGYRVAPFKSQNMALNSFVTRDGLEMGRAQVVQAQAAGIEPDVRMNPILLKPSSDVGSQVIVNGEVRGQMPAAAYFKMKRALIPEILSAYNSLAETVDIIVIEGAGSPAEINLKADDIVNMGLARLVDAPVLLAGDIDRGGVFAQLYGTVALLEVDECFLDFLPQSEVLSAKKLLASPNLIILKAFTKLYGMAGVRLGYCLCSNIALLDKMQSAGQPWAVSSLAQAAGLAALDETAYVARVQALIAQQRPILQDGLRALGLRVLDGSANYLLFQAPETQGDALRQRGIVLRGCGNYPGLDGSWYRTAVRTAPENQQLLKALQEVLA